MSKDQWRGNPPGRDWLWLTHGAMDRALLAGGVNGAAVYLALARIESTSAPEFKSAFFASSLNIARMSGLSTRTVERVIPILSKAKLITVLSGKASRSTSEYQSNKYTLLGSDTQSGRSDTESARDGGHKRYSFHGVKKIILPKHEKNTGSAETLPAEPESSDKPVKKLRNAAQNF